MSRPSSGKPNDRPWQPVNSVTETWKEEEMVAPSPMIPLVSSSSRQLGLLTRGSHVSTEDLHEKRC